ncbi:MAG: metallophosphoesterase [Thermoplasmata archaeon]|nr:metallophosphoesterase [Thermoplasmata archaeon]MCI4359238.1 metallophosphoesterase [Thermoplasmata archaeon]
MTPIPQSPILRLDGPRAHPALLLADLHLGLGGNERLGRGPPEASALILVQTLLDCARKFDAAQIVIAGDVKHPIVGTPRALRPVVFEFFAQLLSEGLEVDVVLGNHDVGLVPFLPREVVVHPASGAIIDGVGVFHGHRWPSDEVLRSQYLVAGHLHPGYRLAPSADDAKGKQRCWVRVSFPKAGPPPKRPPRHAPIEAREMIVVPAFNPIAGTEALNRRRPSPGRSFLFSRFLSRGVARAYLLDGTDLGTLPIR